jgi:hypothetical protein
VKKAAEILSRLLEKGPPGAPAFHSLFGGWQELAGPSLAEHCRPYEVRHHALLVEADHPGWLQLLLMQRKAILARIRQRFPELELRELKATVGARMPGKPAAPAGAPPSSAPTGQEAQAQAPPGPVRPETRQALEAVSDPQLREKLRLLLQELEMRERRIDTSDDK